MKASTRTALFLLPFLVKDVLLYGKGRVTGTGGGASSRVPPGGGGVGGGGVEDAADALGFEFQGTFAKRVDGKFVGYGVEEWRLD